MKTWCLGALTGALVLLSSSGPMAQSAPTAWRIGDVFAGIPPALFDDEGFPIGAGAYRVLRPDGTSKGEPDLSDATMLWSSGCAVDPTAADDGLFTTSFDGMTISRFNTAVPHNPIGPPIDVAALAGIPAELLGSPYPSIESVTFDRQGNMFVGAQSQPDNATAWLGKAWILKVSKTGVLLNSWEVDAGLAENPTKDPAITDALHGVDWLELSRDETTVFYTSEDTFIRSFFVAGPNAGLQGPSIPIHNLRFDNLGNPVIDPGTGQPIKERIGGRAYALRILPPGDPANGFLVATTSGVYRVDGTGRIEALYYDNAVTGYFGLNLTPDGRSFWTGTLDGAIYKFHIASFQGFDGHGQLVVPGSMVGPIATGATSNGGLCVKREYTAVQNVCFDLDLSGNAVPDAGNETGFRTSTCKLPRTPTYCASNPGEPDCATPGAPTLSLTDKLSADGQNVSVQLVAFDPLGQGLTWTVSGLPPGMDANGGPQPLAVSSTGLVTGRIQWHASATPFYVVTVTVTNPRGQSATGQFRWTISGENAPPTLTYSGGPRIVVVGAPLATPITLQSGDADQDLVNLSASFIEYTDQTFTTPAGGPQPGLPAGLQLPRDAQNREATWIDVGYQVPLTGVPTLPGPIFPRFFRVTVEACDCTANWNHNDPQQRALHRVAASFDLTVVTNRAPVCENAVPSQATIWPPNHKFVNITINGVTDPDAADTPVITITAITQDEPVNEKGDGNTGPDGAGIGTSSASVRAERTGVRTIPFEGRVYQIDFIASDGKAGGTCPGTVFVGVPHDQGQRKLPIDSGVRYNSITGQRIY